MKQTITEIRKVMSAAGAEAATAKVLQQMLQPYCDKLYTDPMGNLIAYKKGKGEGRFMVSVGMDLAGVIVTNVMEDGTVRVDGVGGAAADKLNYHTLVFENGQTGVFYTPADAKEATFKEAYVDFATDAPARLGSCATVQTELRFCGDRISGFGASGACCLAAVCQMLKKVETPRCDLFVVFAAQQRVGARGTAVAAASIAPSECISVEPTAAGGYSGAPKCGVVKLGKGVALRLRDAKMMADASLAEEIETTAKKKTILLQREVAAEGESAVAVVPYKCDGVRIAALSLPTALCGSAAEWISLSDLQACTDLLRAMVTE